MRGTPYTAEVMRLLKATGTDIPVVVGSILDRQEARLLKDWGVSGVFPSGSDSKKIVTGIRSVANKKGGESVERKRDT